MTFVPILGVDLYTEVDGEGEPVLVLHGGFASIETMRPLARALATRFRVLAFERPGHGRSPDVDEEYAYERGVAEALAFLDHHGIGAAHVVGHSDGGILGLLLARDHPERVRSLVSISANLDPSAFTTSAAELGAVVLDTLPEPAEPAPDVERALHGQLSPDGPGHADVVLAKLFRLWTSQPRIAPSTLAGVRAPVLVMSGDRDTIRPDHSLLIAASIPGARLGIVPGTTHGLVSERPDLVGPLVLDFLEHVTAG